MILLIRIPSETGKTGSPIGLLYISSYLKKFGYNVSVWDLNFRKLDWEEIVKAKIIGISMLSFMRKDAYKLIKEIREKNKDVKIVIGGMHATALPKILVDNLQIDASVIGEGELTMKELADHWIKGEGELKDIKGIATKEFGIHKSRELINNLDELPFPDYSQINEDGYHCTIAKNRPNLIINDIKISEAKFINLITSRGCIGRCKFCNAFIHWKYKVRFRSAENVLKEIKYLYDEGFRLFNFNDDSFGQNKKIAIGICKGIIERGMKISWNTSMRVDYVDEELLLWMKNAGCFVIAYGVESGSDKILKNIGKCITKEQIRNAIKLTKKVGIKTYALLMVGNQGETTETIQETINLMNEVEIDLHSSCGYVLVYPGTTYCEMMKIKDNYWIKEENGMPTFYDKFNNEDLSKWAGMIYNQIPIRW